MPNNRTGSRYFDINERNKHVIELRRQDFTYREIQEITGMDTSNAARLVKQHLADIPKEAAEELRQWEREKLNVMERDAQEQAYGFRAELDANGKPVWEAICDDNGVVMRNPDGTPMMRIRRDYTANNQGKALLLKIHEARVKMFGLAAPAKFENVGAASEDREIVFRIVDSNGDGRMAAHCMPQPAPAQQTAQDDAAAAAAIGASCFSTQMINGVPVLSLTIPEPTKVEYHDSGARPDPNQL